MFEHGLNYMVGQTCAKAASLRLFVALPVLADDPVNANAARVSVKMWQVLMSMWTYTGVLMVS